MSHAPDCLIHAAYGDPSPAGLPVATGVPFRQGVLRDGQALWVESPSGEARLAAGRALASWPDGSVRWLLVSFGAREPGPHRVRWSGSPPSSTGAEVGVSVRRDGDAWIVDAGRVSV